MTLPLSILDFPCHWAGENAILVLKNALDLISLIWHWTGENKDTISALGSILNPVVLSIGTIFVNGQLTRRSQNAEKERGRREILNSYLSQMTKLLITEKLSVQSHEEPAAQAARALTLATMGELDIDRINQITRFLHDSKLIQLEIDNTSGSDGQTIHRPVLLKSTFFRNRPSGRDECPTPDPFCC